MSYIGSAPSRNTPAYKQVYEFVATAAQTTFSVAYTVGFVEVYRNGVKLGAPNFTANNGTSVVLASGANAGDFIQIISEFINPVLNAIPNTTGAVSSSNIASGVTVNFADGSASAPSITNDGDTNTGIFFPAADTIAFAEGGAEVARFDSSGNLGIGTSSPTAKLDILGSSTTTIKVKSNSGSSGNYSQLLFDTHNSFSGVGQAYIRGVSLADGNSNTGMTFGVNSSGFGAPFEAMRLDSSGNLLVGSSSSTGAKIQAITSSSAGCIATVATASSGVRYHAVWYENSTERGSITSNGGGVSYNTSSDYRLKENVKPIIGALEKVVQLNPVTYTWKGSGSTGQGFIAHELQTVVPDCVTGEKDAVDEKGNPKYQGIDTSFLVATLTAAIQEQQAIITDLKARIETLENK